MKRLFLIAVAASLATPLSLAQKIDLGLPDEEGDRATVDGTLKANGDSAKRMIRSFADSAGIDEAEYAAGISNHLRILGKFDQADVNQLVQIGEYVFRRLNWITFGKTERPWLKRAQGGKALYYFTDKGTFNDLVNYLAESRTVSKGNAKEIMKLSKDLGGHTQRGPAPLVVNRTLHHPASSVANNMGVNWLFYNASPAYRELHLKTGEPQGMGSKGRGRGHRMTWLGEGLGVWAAVDAIGQNNTWRVAKQIYKNVGREKKGKDNDRIVICYEIATAPPKGYKPLYQLTRTKLNALSDIDLAMSWSIVDYLLTSRTAEWRKLIKECRKATSSFRVAACRTFGTKDEQAELAKIRKAKNERGLEQLYMKVISRFEIDWKKWVEKSYEEVYNDPSKQPANSAPFREIKVDAEEGEGDKKKPKQKKKKKKRRRRRR